MPDGREKTQSEKFSCHVFFFFLQIYFAFFLSICVYIGRQERPWFIVGLVA